MYQRGGRKLQSSYRNLCIGEATKAKRKKIPVVEISEEVGFDM